MDSCWSFERVVEAELLLDEAAEVAEHRDLALVEVAGLGVENAEGADVHAGLDGDGHAGVETRMRESGHERALGEAGVEGEIGDDERVVLENGVAAKRNVAGRLDRVDAVLGFEPLAIHVDHRDVGDGDVEDAGGKLDDLVEAIFGRGVEDAEVVERAEAGVFVGWLGQTRDAGDPRGGVGGRNERTGHGS